MTKTERTYTIPLRKEWLKAPSYKRAKRAISAVRSFLLHHMKTERVLLGKYINETVWARGIKHPPGRIKVTVIKSDDGVVRAELHGHAIEEPKEEKKGKLETLKEKIVGKKEKKAETLEGAVQATSAQETKPETPEAKPKRTRTKKPAEPKEQKPEIKTNAPDAAEAAKK